MEHFLRNGHTLVVIQCQPQIWLGEIQSECNIAVQKHNYLAAHINKVVWGENPKHGVSLQIPR